MTNQEALFDLAQVHVALGHSQAAICAYSKLLALDPCHYEARIGLCRMKAEPFEQVRLFTIAELEMYDSGFSTRPTFRSGIGWRAPNDLQLGIDGFLENVARTANRCGRIFIAAVSV